MKIFASLLLLLFTACLVTLLLFFTGCSAVPLKPGMSEIASTNFTVRMKQSENPAFSSVQKLEETTENVTVFPHALGNQPAEVRSKVTRRADTTLGAAQKDTARELAAKLKSLSFLVYLGPLLFLFGVATIAYPPLRLLVGSVTTSVLIMLAGIALTILPVLVVGHELLILSVASGVVLLWFLAHRHGKQSVTAQIYQKLFQQAHAGSPPNPS